MKTIFNYTQKELCEEIENKKLNTNFDIEFDSFILLPTGVKKENKKVLNLILVNDNIPIGVIKGNKNNINIFDNINFLSTIKNHLCDEKPEWSICQLKNNLTMITCNKKLIIDVKDDSYIISLL